jgi:hypothetical protein
MEHPLEGIFEILKRADENIVNLNREIDIWLNDSPAPVGIEDDDETFLKFAGEHIDRKIPLRFSVLAGEVIHHLRTSLNHLAFQLTPEPLRISNEIHIEFPIYREDPERIAAKKHELPGYYRKIEGISKTAKALIKGLQPHKRPDPLNDPLFIIHEMDRTDKHRELALVNPGFNLRLDADVVREIHQNAQLTGNIPSAGDMAMNSKFTAEVAFRQFGEWQDQPVIPSLSQLSKSVRDVVALFVSEFPS